MGASTDLARRADRAPDRFDPLKWIYRTYDHLPRELAFPVDHPRRVSAWRRKLRAALARQLGFDHYRPVPLAPRRLARDEHDDFIREAYQVETLPGLWTVAFVVLPKPMDGPRPGIVCCSGHTSSVNELVGLAEDGSPREIGTGYQKDFAIQAARQGFVAVAHEQIAWGRRRAFDHLKRFQGAHGCWQITMDLLLSGMTLPGLRAFEAIRMADLLRTRDDVVADRIGITGISSGGNVCLFAAAVDGRFSAVVTSGYFCTFRDSILRLHHCMDHYVPGLGRLAEEYDVAALAAPGAFLAETGTQDQGIPVTGTRRAFRRLKAAYRTMGMADRCKLYEFDGPHEWDGTAAWPWFRRFLCES